ncbi:hypothetical protein MHU86_22074 [Fragilaria crotonensis]|nr:hypothetical protein MHU86_22074 [Fragilaria crotonensis]
MKSRSPSRKKSRAPTPSPSAPPIDDDTLGDDAATIETDAPAVDIKPPVPLLVPTPFLCNLFLLQRHRHHISLRSLSIYPIQYSNVPKDYNSATSPVYVPIDDDPIVTQDKEVEEDKEEVELDMFKPKQDCW